MPYNYHMAAMAGSFVCGLTAFAMVIENPYFENRTKAYLTLLPLLIGAILAGWWR